MFLGGRFILHTIKEEMLVLVALYPVCQAGQHDHQVQHHNSETFRLRFLTSLRLGRRCITVHRSR